MNKIKCETTTLLFDIIILVYLYHMAKTRDLKIAENLKKLKKAQKLSQTDLCKRADLAYHTVAKIENGTTPDPRISTIVKIASALNVPVEELIK
jgi:DNA-binding XRE family transcriptional regulator